MGPPCLSGHTGGGARALGAAALRAGALPAPVAVAGVLHQGTRRRAVAAVPPCERVAALVVADPQRVMPIRQGRPSCIYRTTGVVPETHLLRVKVARDMNDELAGLLDTPH